jgi:hypothetical protein
MATVTTLSSFGGSWRTSQTKDVFIMNIELDT